MSITISMPLVRVIHTELHYIMNTAHETRFVIAGGFARWLCLSDAPVPGDIDLFCRTAESLHSEFMDRIQTHFFVEVEDSNPIALRLTLTHKITFDVFNVNLIAPFDERESFGSPGEIITHFDFTVCQAAYVHQEQRVLVTQAFIDDHQDKVIRLNPTRRFNSVRLFERLLKYSKKGYKILPDTIRTMFEGYDPDVVYGWDYLNSI